MIDFEAKTIYIWHLHTLQSKPVYFNSLSISDADDLCSDLAGRFNQFCEYLIGFPLIKLFNSKNLITNFLPMNLSSETNYEKK